MTTVADGLYQYGGIPVGGGVPLPFGPNSKAFFVDPVNGSASNDGLTPKTAFGANGDTAYAAGDYTEVAVKFAVGIARPTPFEVQGERHPAGTECWARCRTSTNTGTLDFMIGLHEYDE